MNAVNWIRYHLRLVCWPLQLGVLVIGILIGVMVR